MTDFRIGAVIGAGALGRSIACGTVNHSDYAVLWRVPVADIGIVGYLFLGVVALQRAWRTALFAAVIGLAFSLYLTYIEAHILQVWCIYCVISLTIVSLITLSNLIMALRRAKSST